MSTSILGSRNDDASTLAALDAAAHEVHTLVHTASDLLGSSAVAIALCTAGKTADDATVLWVNHAFVTLSGSHAAELVGKPSTILAGSHVDRIHMAEVELVHEHPEQTPYGIVTRKQRHDGTWYDVEEHLLPLRGRGKDVLFYLLAERRLR